MCHLTATTVACAKYEYLHILYLLEVNPFVIRKNTNIADKFFT